MTLVQLKHLIALAESGSFSRSAESLFLTQPALSRSIRALEDELGQPLFDRIGRHSELTPFGREVLARARQVVLDADELLDSGRRISAGEAGVLRIGMGSGPGAMLMTPLLMTVATQRPGLHVEVSRATTTLLVQALRERALDALVVDVRSLVPAPDLCVDTVLEMRGAFLCRPGHPLAEQVARDGAVTFADVQRYPIASTPLSDEVARVLMERYGPAAHPAQCVTLRCEEIPSLVAVARGSDTVLIAIRAAGPELVALALQPPLRFNARFGLVTLAARTQAPGLAIVRGLMRTALQDPEPAQELAPGPPPF